MGKVLGFKIEGNGFVLSLINLLERLNEIHWLTLFIGLAGLALLIWLPRRYPKLPAALVTVAIATLVAGLFGLTASAWQSSVTCPGHAHPRLAADQPRRDEKPAA